MDDRAEKRISILQELNINTNDAAIELLHNILSHPHSKNLISSNYIEGIDNSIALYINQMCSDITENNQELWDILFTIKDYCFTGIGKGEMLLSFLFDDVEFNGGSINYDIVSDNGNYEVKCYKNTNTSIRLGTDASVSKFKSYYSIVSILSRLDDIIRIYENCDVPNPIVDNIIDLYTKIVHGTKFSVKTAIDSGEISKKVFDKLKQLFIYLSNIVFTYQSNYNIIDYDNRRYLISVENIDVSERKVDCREIFSVDNADIELTSQLIEMSKHLRAKDVIHIFDTFVDEVTRHINSIYHQHPMIIINDNRCYPVVLGVYSFFDFFSVSKNIVKVKPHKNES